MELVYLWVEEYKNIKEQGFNFSPRFKCEFDGEHLTITENKDYVNIFPENINITAIVGENGSGKSGVLEFIRLALKKDEKNQSYKSLILFFDKKMQQFTLLNLLELKLNNLANNVEIIDYKDIKSFNDTLKHTYFPTFDYSLTSNIKDYQYFTNDKTIEEHLPIYPEKVIHLDFQQEIIRNQTNILHNYFMLKKNNQLEIFEDFFQPHRVDVYFDLSKMFLPNHCEYKDKISKRYNTTIEEVYIEIKNALQTELSINDCLSKVVELAILLSNYHYVHSDPKGELKFDKTGQFIVDEDCESDNFKLSIDDEYSILCHWGRSYNSKLPQKSQLKKVKLKNESTLLLRFDIDDLNDAYIDDIMASFSSHQFKIELVDKNNKKLNDLSFGEQQLLNVLNTLFYIGKKEYTKDYDEGTYDLKIQHFIVFLDEIEYGLHPNWQKRTLDYILDFLKLIPNRNFHLVMVSHSPFIISDLPQQNIIFLKKDTKGNSEIVDGLKEKKQTFGANIHTLLSDGFFMSDGLMGEFAKGKIEAIKKFYESVMRHKDNAKIQKAYRWFFKIKRKEFKQIHSIIGEPFLKTIIGNYLDELEQIFDGDNYAQKQKEKLLNQFTKEELEKHIKGLEND